MKEKKTGFVALIGRPSSGKSTLVNKLCGYKVSITSKHPQTTRFLVKGIYNDDNSQIVFIDSPGYHNFNSNLNRGLSNLAVRNTEDADVILYVIDTAREFGREEEDIIDNIKPLEGITIVVLNKIDLDKSDMEIKNKVLEKINPAGVVEFSALKGKEAGKIINLIKKKLQIGPMYFPEDYVTDQSIPFRITEVVREKIFQLTKEEVPHSCYAEVEDLKVSEDKIEANVVIFVENESQKGIIIGAKGSMIKMIGVKARYDLTDIFERKVNLFLNVKVHKDWRKKDEFLKKMFDIT